MNGNDIDPLLETPSPGETGRLDSWKKIAAHFKRDVTTVQRWERREGMPVHRHLHDRQGSVYAFRSELDNWWASRRDRLPEASSLGPEPAPEPAQPEVTPASAERLPGQSPNLTRRVGLAAALGASVLLAYALFEIFSAHGSWRNPLANATFTRLTDWPGIEQAAEISRDGRWASFLADRDGHLDAWLTQIGSGSYRNLTGGAWRELENPSIRTLGFSADGSLVTVWTRSDDGSRPEDIKVMAAPVAGGELRDLLPGVAELAWSRDGKQLAYHTTAPGDPLFVRDAHGVTRQIYVAPAGMHCHFPVWSPDDAYIYFTRGTPPGDWDVWRIRPSGSALERITFQHAHLTHPVMIDERTLLYLANDAQGAGPWLYALDVQQRDPHRISTGLERYTSLAASDRGTRLVATIQSSKSSLWSVPIESGPESDRHDGTQPASLVAPTGVSPRAGAQSLLYVATRSGHQGIWKQAEGRSEELWSDARATVVGAPALAADGRHIAFVASEGERSILYAMGSDGKELRALTQSLALRGNPAWSPDGRSIVCAALHDGEPRLMRIFLDDRPPAALVSEYSIDPVWAPDGGFLIYTGADVGTTFPVRAVAADGRPYPIPALILTRGARRLVFLPHSQSIVMLRGDVGHKNFWLVDLKTGAERQITTLAPDVVIRDFDLSRDGREILFDRLQESSETALIERGG